ncbi:MAG TPA: phosphoribosylamine--glycine ligase, partial [Propionibacterium sp.]|nr:phosphoribosylamine--glycine ligase [Propionibacterium sp.]
QPDAYVLHAGTRLDDGQLVAAGGRVLGIVGRGSDVDQARANAYGLLEQLDYEDGFHRTDIGIPH